MQNWVEKVVSTRSKVLNMDAEVGQGGVVEIKVSHAGTKHQVKFGIDRTIGELKIHLQGLTKVPKETMRLMCKGLIGGPGRPDLDARSLADNNIKSKSKVMVCGASLTEIIDVGRRKKSLVNSHTLLQKFGIIPHLRFHLWPPRRY